MSTLLCHRCGSRPGTVRVLDMNVCPLCASSLRWKFGRNVVGAGVDFFDPFSLGQSFGEAMKPNPSSSSSSSSAASVPASVPGPYALGQNLGAAIKGDASPLSPLSNIGQGLSDTAKTVRVVAASAALLGIAAIAYTMWSAHRTQKRAFEIAAAHAAAHAPATPALTTPAPT